MVAYLVYWFNQKLIECGSPCLISLSRYTSLKPLPFIVESLLVLTYIDRGIELLH